MTTGYVKWMNQQQLINSNRYVLFSKKNDPHRYSWKYVERLVGHRKQMKTVLGSYLGSDGKAEIPEKKQDGRSLKKTGII